MFGGGRGSCLMEDVWKSCCGDGLVGLEKDFMEKKLIIKIY